MLDLEIISLNTRGLSDYTKRRKVFNYFRKKTSPNGIVLAQETHSTRIESVKFLGSTSGAEQTQSDFHMVLPLVEGFFIAFREKLDYVILDEYSHDNGNFLIIHVRIQGLPVILVNYYAPNGEKEQVEVLIQIKKFLSKIEYDQNTAMI